MPLKSFRSCLGTSGALSVLACFILVLIFVGGAFAAKHPVPLDPKADPATCIACHNSDDNREFGGTGPNGPHGSVNSHILEHNYQFSQSAAPGGLVTNTFPNPDLSLNGPYGMCAKCHNLSNVVANASFLEHGNHIAQDGFSCSVCHTAHGMGSVSPSVSGERLVNFDANVVGQNNGAPISYNRGSNTCVLTCHQTAHNADGSVSSARTPIQRPKTR